MQPEASQEGSAKQFERDHLWISKLVKIQLWILKLVKIQMFLYALGKYKL